VYKLEKDYSVKEIIKKFHNSGLKDDIKLSYRYDDLD
jgi:hypothetical protein